MSRTAAAPSVRNELLAAVTEPNLRSKAGDSRAIFSAVVSPRKPLSATIGFLREGRKAGSICVSSPASVALAARWCDSAANSSCSARVIASRRASRSQFWPMVSPVVNSAMAGASGRRSAGLRPPRSLSQSPAPLAFCEAIRRLRTALRKRMGRRRASRRRRRRRCLRPRSDGAHAVDGGLQGGDAGDGDGVGGAGDGIPAPTTTSRPRLVVAGRRATVPMTSRSIAAGSTRVR